MASKCHICVGELKVSFRLMSPLIQQLYRHQDSYNPSLNNLIPNTLMNIICVSKVCIEYCPEFVNRGVHLTTIFTLDRTPNFTHITCTSGDCCIHIYISIAIHRKVIIHSLMLDIYSPNSMDA